MERWCRLRGNLLFYFKSRDHWSEPAGVIVVEDCEVRPEAASPLDDSTFGLVLSFGGGQLQHLATYTEVRNFQLICIGFFIDEHLLCDNYVPQ